MSGRRMNFGIVLPGVTAAEQFEQAVIAEEAGGDGVFVPETTYGADSCNMRAGLPARTSRVRLGTMLTPLPWRRPWKVASQVATVDQLSGGRAILGVGIGALGTDLPDTHEATGVAERAAMLDEGIDLIRGLWDGARDFEGEHYQYRTGRMELTAAVRPAQERIPIWVVGVWPRPRSMRRVLRCDGMIPQFEVGDRAPLPDDARAVRAWLSKHGASPDLDIVAEGESPADDVIAAAAQAAEGARGGGGAGADQGGAGPGPALRRGGRPPRR